MYYVLDLSSSANNPIPSGPNCPFCEDSSLVHHSLVLVFYKQFCNMTPWNDERMFLSIFKVGMSEPSSYPQHFFFITVRTEVSQRTVGMPFLLSIAANSSLKVSLCTHLMMTISTFALSSTVRGCLQ